MQFSPFFHWEMVFLFFTQDNWTNPIMLLECSWLVFTYNHPLIHQSTPLSFYYLLTFIWCCRNRRHRAWRGFQVNSNAETWGQNWNRRLGGSLKPIKKSKSQLHRNYIFIFNFMNWGAYIYRKVVIMVLIPASFFQRSQNLVFRLKLRENSRTYVIFPSHFQADRGNLLKFLCYSKQIWSGN